jgi:hypothetical protein
MKGNNFENIGLRCFFRTFSYRELLSIFSLVFFLICLNYLEFFYPNAKIFTNTKYWLLEFFIFFIIMSINHIFYKIEHKRSNNYLGRIIMDVAFFLTLHFLSNIIGFNRSLDIEIIVVFSFFLLLWELFISGIKQFTRII